MRLEKSGQVLELPGLAQESSKTLVSSTQHATN
jgi:hypothetical protein